MLVLYQAWGGRMWREKTRTKIDDKCFHLFITRLKLNAAAASIALRASPTMPLRKLRLSRWSLSRCPMTGSVAARRRKPWRSLRRL